MPSPPPARLALPPAIAALLLSACTAMQPPGGAPDARASRSGECRAEPVQWAIGEDATQEISGRIWRESHAGPIRPIAPGQAVTRDFRADRVNIEVDADNRIVRIYCG